MKIINNTPLTPFRNVEFGSVFKYADAILMRTDDNVTELGTMNAVNLESGFAVSFYLDDMVSPLPKAHVVLE